MLASSGPKTCHCGSPATIYIWLNATFIDDSNAPLIDLQLSFVTCVVNLLYLVIFIHCLHLSLDKRSFCRKPPSPAKCKIETLEMWKCFWSQILLMKMNKSYCTMPALTKLQTRGDLNLLLAGQPVNESEWHQCQKPVHGRSFPITTKLLVTTIEIFWVMWLQSEIPSSWGVRSPDPHRRVGRGTWLPPASPIKSIKCLLFII